MASSFMRLPSKTGILVLLLVALLGPAGVSAQQPIVPLQLSFSDPGARSMGFGGAFVALADDATAAFANPAGLPQLLKPELSVEGRYWSYATAFTVGGRAEGLPSGNGIDTTVGIRTAKSEEDIAGISFLSVALPVGNWSFAFYRHEYANLEFSSETQGIFSGGTDCCQIREFDQRATSKLDFIGYGLSVGYRVSDRFDLGAGVVYYDAALDSHVTLFYPDDDTVASIFAPNSYLAERTLLSQRSFLDDHDWTLTGGFLWRLTEYWSVGGVYRQGLRTSIEIEQRAGEAFDFGVAPGEIIARAPPQPLDFPDIFGIGLAYRSPDGRLTASFQWDRVEYSVIPRSLRLDDQTMDDANELHLGAEFVFLGSTPIVALRLGTWFEPDHQMYAMTDEPLVRALLQRGDGDFHYSTGVGVAMDRFQVDLALDFADRVDTVSLSAIYNF